MKLKEYICHIINFFEGTNAIHRFPYSGKTANLNAKCRRCGSIKGETKEWKDYCKWHDECVKRGRFDWE